MNHYVVFVYGVCFTLIGEAAFVIVFANIMSLDMKRTPSKPEQSEAPSACEEVMDVRLSKERLEKILSDESLCSHTQHVMLYYI